MKKGRRSSQKRSGGIRTGNKKNAGRERGRKGGFHNSHARSRPQREKTGVGCLAQRSLIGAGVFFSYGFGSHSGSSQRRRVERIAKKYRFPWPLEDTALKGQDPCAKRAKSTTKGVFSRPRSIAKKDPRGRKNKINQTV